MAAMRFQQVHRKNILALGALSVLDILTLILYFIDQILTKKFKSQRACLMVIVLFL